MISNSTLESISFTDSTFTDKSINRLCIGCPGLTSLALKTVDDSDDIDADIGITDDAVRSIVTYCPGIEKLSLSGWNCIFDDSMIALTTLAALKELDISRCFELTSAGVQSMLRSAGTNIEVLILANSGEVYSFKGCDDALLRCIGASCPKLKHFSVTQGSLSPNTDVTEASLLALIGGCPLLENFLVHFEKIADTVWIHLADCCPRLTTLDLSYVSVTEVGVATLARCKRLENFTLYDPTPIALQSFVSNMVHYSGLKELDLSLVSLLTDQSFCAVFQSLTRLTNVTLAYLPRLTDRSILVLVRSGPKIKNFTLYCLKGLTDRSLAALITLDDLEVLTIGSCPRLTEHTVRSIACHCWHLCVPGMVRLGLGQV